MASATICQSGRSESIVASYSRCTANANSSTLSATCNTTTCWSICTISTCKASASTTSATGRCYLASHGTTAATTTGNKDTVCKCCTAKANIRGTTTTTTVSGSRITKTCGTATCSSTVISASLATCRATNENIQDLSWCNSKLSSSLATKGTRPSGRTST